MSKITDLKKWKELSKEEKELVKKTIAVKSYANFDGKGSVSLKELKKGKEYQKEIHE